MARRRSERRHDVDQEPHLRPGAFYADDSNRLEDEPARASQIDPDPQDDPADSAVSDEPSLGWRLFDRTTHPGYAEMLLERLAATPFHRKLLVMIGAALFAGPFAVFGAFFKSAAGDGGWGYMAVVVVGPVLEEMLKIACVLWLVERRPWLIIGPWSIVAAGAVGGLSFAAIENWVYLNVYFPEHTRDLVTWRWSVGTTLHAGCSIIAALGIAKMWRAVIREARPADLTIAFPWLAGAMLIHGAYNAFAVAIDFLGYGPS